MTTPCRLTNDEINLVANCLRNNLDHPDLSDDAMLDVLRLIQKFEHALELHQWPVD